MRRTTPEVVRAPKNLRDSRSFGTEPQTVCKPCKPRNSLVALWGCTLEHAQPPPHPRHRRVRVTCGGMKGRRCTPFQQTTQPPSTCGCSPRVDSGLPRREDHASNLVGPVRDVRNRARRAAHAVPGDEAHRTKMSDARAERAPEALMDPTDTWGTLGTHVVEAKGARGAASEL